MKMSDKFIIVDEFDNHCFTAHEFDSYEDGWEFLYIKFPVLYNFQSLVN